MIVSLTNATGKLQMRLGIFIDATHIYISGPRRLEKAIEAQYEEAKYTIHPVSGMWCVQLPIAYVQDPEKYRKISIDDQTVIE